MILLDGQVTICDQSSPGLTFPPCRNTQCAMWFVSLLERAIRNVAIISHGFFFSSWATGMKDMVAISGPPRYWSNLKSCGTNEPENSMLKLSFNH